jgi:DNA-binding NtrC family response regulator
MQQSQIVTFGLEGSLAESLRELAQARRIWLRETSQYAACQSLVSSTAPLVFVLVLGKDLEREMAMLDLVHAALPETAVIVVGEADNPTLAGLAWDLGATYVLFPPTLIEVIGEVIARCLEETPA